MSKQMSNIKIGMYGAFILLGLIIAGGTLGWFGDAVGTVVNQTKPSELLRKYEWFKDAAANLTAKKQNVSLYEGKITAFSAIKDQSRTDKENFMLWNQELVGLKASYNNLKAEYNAQMAKVNWAFCEIGSVPDGAEELPRSFE